MSRIGKQPVPVLDGVKVSIDGSTITTEGPQGKLQFEHRPEISLELDEENKQILVTRGNDERMSRALHGLTRSLINNMVVGVKEGYEKRLEIVGVGYGGTVQGNELALRVGFANEIKKAIPSALDVTCPDQNHVVIKGCDKQKVGQFAAEVRAVRKPEPYKGKGVRVVGEYVRRKEGKKAT